MTLPAACRYQTVLQLIKAGSPLLSIIVTCPGTHALPLAQPQPQPTLPKPVALPQQQPPLGPPQPRASPSPHPYTK